jgi:transposase
MARTYLPVMRDPQALRDSVSDAHLVWFALAVVQRVDTSALHACHRREGVGRPAYDPETLLAVLTYADCRGERSSRRIERLCRVDPAYRMLSGGQAPDHSTIARFRQQNQGLVVRLAAEVSQLSEAAGLAPYEAGQGRLFAIDDVPWPAAGLSHPPTPARPLGGASGWGPRPGGEAGSNQVMSSMR